MMFDTVRFYVQTWVLHSGGALLLNVSSSSVAQDTFGPLIDVSGETVRESVLPMPGGIAFQGIPFAAPPLADVPRRQSVSMVHGRFLNAFQRIEIARMTFRGWIVSAVFVLLLVSTGGTAHLAGQETRTPDPTLGIKARKPVLGAACRGCPWGAAAEIVKQAMKPYGYDVQICNNCALPEAPRIVSGARMPPPWKPSTNPNNPDYLTPKPPQAPVDFGTAASLRVWQAYQGIDDYAKEEPHKNLRLIANLQNPNYLAIAVKADSGITDLNQIKEKHMAVRMITQGSPEIKEILAYYGLTEEAVKAAGGSYLRGSSEDLKTADVIIHNAALGNAPEYNIWLEASQKYDLRFLELPSDLLDKVARENEIDRGTMPLWLYRGVDRPIQTVVQTGNAIYTRADVPDDFAYAVAKALDEQQDLLQWSHLNFYYNMHNVWKDRGLPLHPGAARYYRERGYMK